MQRSPDAVPLWESVAARHHADDRDRRAADANDAADDVRRAVQLVLPEVVSDHHDLFSAAPFVGFQQRASHQRRNARQSEGGRGHIGDGLRLTWPGADGDAAFFHLDGAEIGDRAETVAPQLVITARCGDPRIVGDIPVPQCNDRVAVRKRNRRPERLSRDLEPDGADGDRERYGNRCDQGERRMLDQHATPEPELEPQPAEPRQPPRLPAHLLVLLHPAERDRRLPSRLGRVQAPLALEPLGFHLQVEAHLLVHFGAHRFRVPQLARIGTQAGEQSHHAQISWGLVRSASAMASASRFQLATSSPRRARPAEVRR